MLASPRISPDLPQYIRTLIRGDQEGNAQVQARLDAQEWEGFPRFLAATFFLAVDRRFGEGAEAAEVIKFVAELRADLSHGGPEISAEAAETLINSIIDSDIDYSIDQEMIGRIQAATVYKALTDENISDSDLDGFLAEAVQLANR